jgi:hypothetical protein
VKFQTKAERVINSIRFCFYDERYIPYTKSHTDIKKRDIVAIGGVV